MKNEAVKIIKTIRKKVIDEIRSIPGKSWFVDSHLLVVEKLANQLCDFYPKADREAVLLSVWFHDIGHIRKKKKHDLYGAKEAKRILKPHNIPKEKIDLVYEICRSHRCEEIKPKSLEVKILATADAMSHLFNAFYCRLFFEKQFGKTFEENKKAILKKLERDFHNKILLPKAKKIVKPLYEAWKKILSA